MLNEYKEVFQGLLDINPEVKKMDQIDLANKYLEGGPRAEVYLSALILRYWHIIDKIAYKDYGLYDEKEVYDWFMDSLLYAINYAPWRDPESSIYGDPKAFEKVMNTCIHCSRANWFQASNRHKRKINHHIASLDALSEDYKDTYMPADMTTEIKLDFSSVLVSEAFSKQQYLLAIIIDIIAHDLPLDRCTDKKSLVMNIRKCILDLPENYYLYFAKEYNLPQEKVEKSLKLIYNMSDSKLRSSIESYVFKLRSILKEEV